MAFGSGIYDKVILTSIIGLRQVNIKGRNWIWKCMIWIRRPIKPFGFKTNSLLKSKAERGLRDGCQVAMIQSNA